MRDYILLLFIALASTSVLAESRKPTCSESLTPPEFHIDPTVSPSHRDALERLRKLEKEQIENATQAKNLAATLGKLTRELDLRLNRMGLSRWLTGLIEDRPYADLAIEDLRKEKKTNEARRSSVIEERARIDREISENQTIIKEQLRLRPAIVREEFAGFLSDNPRYAAAAQDTLNANALAAVDSKQKISLLMGSSGSDPGPAEIDAARTLVGKAADRGYLVLVDAHSRLSTILLEEFPQNTLGVAAFARVDLAPHRQIVITDSYLRWLALTDTSKVIGCDTSDLALAALVFNNVDEFLSFNPRFDGGALESWRNSMSKRGQDLNLPAYKKIAVRNADEIAKGFKDRFQTHGFRPASFAALDVTQLEALSAQVNQQMALRAAIAGVPAAVLGSGSLDSNSAPLIYEVAYDLSQAGVGVITGGAGGAMLAANMGAFDAGGESIGVPLVGRKALASEADSPTQFHTRTIPVSSYEFRIPLLIEEKRLLVIAPGGAGTLRELVAALVRFSHDSVPTGGIVLLTDYYTPLHDFLISSGMSATLAGRLHLVRSREDFRAIASRLVGEMNALDRPRTSRTSFSVRN